MEGAQRSKRRRVYSFDPNSVTYSTFPRKYASHLLPALLRAATAGKSPQIEKMVRFEVDMALVLSTDEFKWSRALKHKLEEGGSSADKLSVSSQCCPGIELSGLFAMLKRFDYLESIPRSIVSVEATTRPKISSKRSTKKSRAARGEEELLACRVQVLRRILPGGGEMSLYELLSEVQSYVVCLQLQVDVLRSLVAAE